MKYAITKLIVALDEVIAELLEAGARAKAAGKRAAERNVGEFKLSQMRSLRQQLLHEEEYITQPEFHKYFGNGEGPDPETLEFKKVRR